MYLATVNAEITNIADRTVDGSKIAKLARKSKKLGNPQPMVYYVGSAFGKRYAAANSRTAEQNGTKKRPHVRRSHFHHYWVGSGDDKKLILKWVSAVFVNGSGEDTVPTVKNVE